MFGEIYYQAIPDTLKFTVGLRYTDDIKSQVDRIELYDNGDSVRHDERHGAITGRLRRRRSRNSTV